MPVFQTALEYEGGEKAGVSFIALAGLASLLSILYLIIFKRPNPTTFKNTNMLGYLISLLIANLLQSVGTVMNFGWVAKGRVEVGSVCSAQGSIKHAGNLGASIWTVVIAIHLFSLLFLRIRADTALFLTIICFVWTFIVVIVLIGPVAIEKAEKGPYYGPTGVWCWITSNYPKEQLFLEYFFAFLSASICFILYVLVLLRIRGTLVKNGDNRWRLRFIPPGDVGKLVVTGRNTIDSSTLRISQRMVWYPIAYTILVFPLTLTRLSAFDGRNVPFWATAIASVMSNLMGFVNVMLIICLERWFPAVASTLPTASSSGGSSTKPRGFVPLTLRHIDYSDQKEGHDRTVTHAPLRVHITLPTKPQNTFIPPEEWQSTAQVGKL